MTLLKHPLSPDKGAFGEGGGMGITSDHTSPEPLPSHSPLLTGGNHKKEADALQYSAQRDGGVTF